MVPLADRMRPKNLAEYIGQKHILSEDKLLYKAIKNGQIFSMVFWGPPGVGKTTLARIIASEAKAEFLEFSAVNTSISDVKRIIDGMQKPGQLLAPPIVFIDEIHRFNKAQQDAFLPLVETGQIILIGATTENPSFEIINALLSRTRVFVLEQLKKEDLVEIIRRALKDKENGLGKHKISIKPDALELLIEGSNGDGRVILNILEMAAAAVIHDSSLVIPAKAGIYANKESHGSRVKHGMTQVKITRDLIKEALQQRMLSYDKNGEEHYNTISAFIKSMRASNVDAALYYLARMVDSGEDPLFIARRMVIFASEDIGQAQPTALVVANEVFRACETIGYPECQINLAHGVVYLASAKKDRSSYDAYFKALSDVKEHGNLPIPMNLRNAPTKLMKNLGYGKDYQKYTTESLLPEKLKGKKYY